MSFSVEIAFRMHANCYLVRALVYISNDPIESDRHTQTWHLHCMVTVITPTVIYMVFAIPGPCITNVIATCRRNFSQWESSFLWKLRCHWLKFLRRVAKTLVIQGPGLWKLLATRVPLLDMHSYAVDTSSGQSGYNKRRLIQIPCETFCL